MDDDTLKEVVSTLGRAELAMVRASAHLTEVSKEMATSLQELEALLVTGEMIKLDPANFKIVSERIAKILESVRHPIDGMQLAYDTVTRTISAAQAVAGAGEQG